MNWEGFVKENDGLCFKLDEVDFLCEIVTGELLGCNNNINSVIINIVLYLLIWNNFFNLDRF